MSRGRSRPANRFAACLFALALVPTALVACGDDDSAQKLTFTLSADGKGSKVALPTEAETGLAEITLENNGKRGGDLQLIRVEGNHSPKEVIQGLSKAMEGQPFPDWFFAGGGTGITPPGKSSTVEQVLQPGTYYAFDTAGTQGPPDAKSLLGLEVTGEESDEEVGEADATVSAVDYGFEAEELPSGKTEIAFENTGAQPHHLLASRLTGDSTAEDAEQFFKTEKGKPPLEDKGTQATAVLEGGESQLVTLNLKSGRYVLYCFISDRAGGPPHVVKGMVDEVEVVE